MEKKERFKLFVKELFLRIKEDDITATGAEISYYLLLSVFPFMIFFLNILSLTPLTDKDVFNHIIILIPAELRKLFTSFIGEITENSSQTLLSLSIILALWSASAGIMAIIKSINKSFRVEEERPGFILKLMSVAFTFVGTVLVILVLVSLVFGQFIGNKIFSYFNLGEAFLKTWNILRIIIPIITMIIIFALLYKFSLSPNNRRGITIFEALPGALVTTLGWIISSYFFSFYVNNFGKFSTTYGSLGAIIILLLWLYMTSIVIVLGGEVNAVYNEVKDKKLGS